MRRRGERCGLPPTSQSARSCQAGVNARQPAGQWTLCLASPRLVVYLIIDADHMVYGGAGIAITLSLCVCAYVCGYVSSIKRKPLTGMT